MAETITEWQARQYSDNVNYVYDGLRGKSVDSLVMGEMIHSPVQGVLDSFNPVSNGVARDKVDRYEDTVWSELAKSRRWCRPYKTYMALPLDTFDQARSAVSNINGVHTTQIAKALRNREFIRFFAAAVGTAITGENAAGTSALPSAQGIALGTTPSDVLTLTKVKSASALFDLNGVPADPSVRHWGYAPGQKSAILAITQAASSDFTKNRIYDKGNIDGDMWMGFTWHMFADVRGQDDASGLSTLERILPISTTTRTNIAWSTDAIGISRISGVRTRLSELPDKTYTWQAYGEIDVNMVRVLDGGVVSILCLEE